MTEVVKGASVGQTTTTITVGHLHHTTTTSRVIEALVRLVGEDRVVAELLRT